jgi:MerR family mercuric resistance operon transcriptional regulator
LGTEGEAARAEARGIASAHVADIRAKVADLQATDQVLTEAMRECETGRQPRCPLIEVLQGS